MPVRIEPYDDDRGTLRPLFELAEDSASELDGYLAAGRVIVARDGDAVVGHLQLTDTGEPSELELDMAVLPGARAPAWGARSSRQRSRSPRASVGGR